MPSVNRKVIVNPPRSLGSASDYTRAIQDEASQLVVSRSVNPNQAPLLRLFRTPILASFTNTYNPFIPTPWTGGGGGGGGGGPAPPSGVGGVLLFNNLHPSIDSVMRFPGNSEFVIPVNQPFTMECYLQVNPTSGAFATYFSLGGSTGFWADVNTGSTDRIMRVNVGGISYNVDNTILPPAIYANLLHCALVGRTSKRADLYINGQRVVTGTSTNERSIIDITNQMCIGARGDSGLSFVGKVSNFRFVNGTAIYPDTPTITIPRVPLSAVPGTVVLVTSLTEASRFTNIVTGLNANVTVGANPIGWESRIINP